MGGLKIFSLDSMDTSWQRLLFFHAISYLFGIFFVLSMQKKNFHKIDFSDDFCAVD